MRYRQPCLALTLPLLALLAGCGGSYSPDTYAAAAAQQANKVERGVIVGARKVAISADGTTGTVTGGAAGGIAGSQTPFGPVVRAFTALGGTLVGGLAGSAAERAVGDTDAWEYIVREPNGDLVSVTQQDAVPMLVGTRVLVIEGKQARVVPDYTVSGAADPLKHAAPPPRPAAASVAAPSRPAAAQGSGEPSGPPPPESAGPTPDASEEPAPALAGAPAGQLDNAP